MNAVDVEHYFVLNILIEYTNFIDMFIVGIAGICRSLCCGNRKAAEEDDATRRYHFAAVPQVQRVAL